MKSDEVGGASLNRQNFYFHQRALGQVFNRYGRTCREGLGEELGIYLVHGNEVGHIAEEDSCLHNMGQVGTSRRQHLRGIGEHLACLLLYATFYKVAGGRVNGYLAAAEYHTIHFYRLAVGTNGRRRLVCTDYFHGLCLLIRFNRSNLNALN